MKQGPAQAALLALALAGCSAAAETNPDPFTATGELVALSGGDAGASNACFTCHGLDGAGNGAGAPRLAGLGLGYLNRQMEDYASGRRQHPEMHYIAARLDAGERQAVSAYYAAMRFAANSPPPHPFASSLSKGSPSSSARAEEDKGLRRAQPERDRVTAARLYVEGDPARQLPACATCHGASGEGVGQGNPPLAGQSAAYLAAQLHAWRLGRRRGDAGNLMLAISRRLTPAEIRSVSAHAASLGPAASRPVSPGASREARRDDPRNDASAPPPRGAAPAR
jgi:cytochrome c553